VLRTQSTSYDALPDDRFGDISDAVAAVLHLDGPHVR
jgi:hypothetical protein